MTPPADLREPVELAGQLSVVIPVYNEEATIEQLVNLVLARPEPGELIIVNDASKDRSWERLQAFRANPRVKLFNQEVNQGKGAAVIRGFSLCADSGCRFRIFAGGLSDGAGAAGGWESRCRLRFPVHGDAGNGSLFPA